MPSGKREITAMMTKAEAAEKMKELFDAGKIIEAGFVFRLLSLAPDDMQAGQVAAMRQAFFLGAEYMLNTMQLPQNVGVWGDEDVERMVVNVREELAEYGARIAHRRAG
jgi:hypothetical protein